MNTELSFKTAICSDYEQLLNACKKTMEIWRQRREEVLMSGSCGNKTGEELLRLQANYAKAYSRLESHEERCELCRFVSKIGGRDYASISNVILEKKRPA